MTDRNIPNEHVAADEAPRRRFQCITIDAESVVLNGEDFDRMTAELAQLRADVDRGAVGERAGAWETLYRRLLEIDPRMNERARSGLGSALHLVNELANRSALSARRRNAMSDHPEYLQMQADCEVAPSKNGLCGHPKLYVRDMFNQPSAWGSCLLCERDSLIADRDQWKARADQLRDEAESAGETSVAPLKGAFEGECNRTACRTRPATWYSEVEKAHYCEPCAVEINKWVPPTVSRLVRIHPNSGTLRESLRVYGGHIPPCPGRPCACGFQQAWDAAGLTVKTSTEPTQVCHCADPEPALADHGLNAICEKCYQPIHAGAPT